MFDDVFADFAPLREPPTCSWYYCEHHDYWQTQCNNAWSLIAGTPEENKMRFCSYCGKVIRVVTDMDEIFLLKIE